MLVESPKSFSVDTSNLQLRIRGDGVLEGPGSRPRTVERTTQMLCSPPLPR